MTSVVHVMKTFLYNEPFLKKIDEVRFKLHAKEAQIQFSQHCF
jgi:hypothetical protein